jgi:hypothetical protein
MIQTVTGFTIGDSNYAVLFKYVICAVYPARLSGYFCELVENTTVDMYIYGPADSAQTNRNKRSRRVAPILSTQHANTVKY